MYTHADIIVQSKYTCNSRHINNNCFLL